MDGFFLRPFVFLLSKQPIICYFCGFDVVVHLWWLFLEIATNPIPTGNVNRSGWF